MKSQKTDEQIGREYRERMAKAAATQKGRTTEAQREARRANMATARAARGKKTD